MTFHREYHCHISSPLLLCRVAMSKARRKECHDKSGVGGYNNILGRRLCLAATGASVWLGVSKCHRVPPPSSVYVSKHVASSQVNWLHRYKFTRASQLPFSRRDLHSERVVDVCETFPVVHAFLCRTWHRYLIMSNRAFDTTKLGSGYGFESFPQKRLEMPPTWAILVALTFLVGALLFWVSICRETQTWQR